MRFLIRVLNDIRSGQNLDIYVTAFLSLTVACLSIFGIVNSNIVSATLLAVLALLLGSFLTARQQNNAMQFILIKARD